MRWIGRIEPIEIEVSRADSVITDAPVSTEGEREAESFNEPPPLAEPPEEEVAEDNLAENIEDEITQILDGIEFDGAWRPVAGLADGGFVISEQNLAFQMQYSLTDAQGIVVVELPDTATSTAFSSMICSTGRFRATGSSWSAMRI